MKKIITDRALKAAAKNAAPGRRPTLWDATVPGLGARVSEKGAISFVVMKRLGAKVVRHRLGDYGALTLEQARGQARTALQDFAAGQHPKARLRAVREEAERRQRNTFGNVAELFVERHVKTLRSARQVEAVIRRELVARWGDRPISEITRSDLIACLREVMERSGRSAALHVYAYAGKLWNWAIASDLYGLERSPLDHVKKADLIGTAAKRQRFLSESELRALWAATEELGYPFGPLFRLLLLTGQQRDQVGEMTWAEVDLAKRWWTIPPERAKNGFALLVPLSSTAVDLLAGLPRFAGGDFVFSTTAGARPVSGFSKAKTRLDAIMERRLGIGQIPSWRLHDLRRTARTHFSASKLSSDKVRELALGHVQQGVSGTCDVFAYRGEKAALFRWWDRRLQAIVTAPPPENVIALRARQRAVGDAA
jgi:integrase